MARRRQRIKTERAVSKVSTFDTGVHKTNLRRRKRRKGRKWSENKGEKRPSKKVRQKQRGEKSRKLDMEAIGEKK